MASQPINLYSMADINIPHGQKAEEWETIPSCFAFQLLHSPGVMYFISLVRFLRGESSSMSVHRPGIALGDGRARFNATSSAGEVRSHSPVQLQDSPDFEVRLQHKEGEHREPDGGSLGEVSHKRQ